MPRSAKLREYAAAEQDLQDAEVGALRHHPEDDVGTIVQTKSLANGSGVPAEGSFPTAIR